jgi:RimJ/RimL family protein N-acetyltransferase
MIIECENIQLQLIVEEDLELIRNWRNEPHVSAFMEYQENIDEAAQKKWFHQLNKETNLYFKILVSGEPIGVINLKDIDWEKKTAEAGVFVGRKDFIGGITPIFSVLILMKTAFRCLMLTRLFAKISKHNTNALNFNKQLGYEFYESVNSEFDRFTCTKNQFYSPQSSISKLTQLVARNAAINIYIYPTSEWILKYMHIDERTFHLFRNQKVG